MKRFVLFILGVFLATLSLVVTATSAQAATITVTNTDDSGPGSLRQAITDAQPGDTIVFDLPYPAVIALTSGELPIEKDLTIHGPGASRLTISGSGVSRIFNIAKGVAVTITDITIADGKEYNGAGIHNCGTLTLVRCTIANNIADWDGGGIYNHYDRGVLEVRESAFIGNRAAYGGGIKNESATATLTNCTFYNNSAGYRGGGIDNGRQTGYSSSVVNITNCTFARNIGRGIGNPASTTTAQNTIVADNTDEDCAGSFAMSSSNNFSTDNTCSPGFTQVTSAQLALGALSGNPAYLPLASGSAAIDAGTNIGCPTIDQRGAARPQDGNGDGAAVCDVGSYELSRTLQEHLIPTANSQPYGIAADANNVIWFTELAGNKIGKLTLNQPPASSFQLPASSFQLPASSHRSIAGATITEYAIPTADSSPAGIVSGPDGAIWFTEYAGNKIGRITPAGAITEYALPNPNSAPIAIAVGPDGNLWFCEDTGNRIGKMSPAGELLAEYAVPTANSAPNAIVAGPDGALWFTEYEGKKIGRITTDGVITEYPVSAKAFGIAVGPDGNLWFTETNANRIGRMTPTGEMTEFDLPGGPHGPQGIVAGPLASLWVAASFSDRILRVSPAGVVLAEYAIPTTQSAAVMIAVDGRGNLWFTEMRGHQIGQLLPRSTLYLPLVLR